MKKLLSLIVGCAQAAAYEMQFTGMDEHMSGQQEYAEVLHRSRLWIAIFLDFPLFLYRGLLCHFKGHDWEDDSYGDAEGGCMAGHCTRCGYSFHHTLY